MPKHTTELPTICRSAPDHVSVLKARHGGVEVSLAAGSSDRKELLSKLRSGAEVVELEVDVRAFQQVKDAPNHNFVRFKNSILGKLAKSFAGAPFQKDHDESLDARGGTVIAAKAEKIPDGTAFDMTVRLTAPWAVEGVLSGNLDRFSIGWFHGGLETVECSACKACMLDCSHFPGDRLDNGKKVEFVFTEAGGRELSAVSVPAVEGTGISEIRSALSTPRANRGTTGRDTRKGKDMEKITKTLGLKDDADESTVVAAIEMREAQAKANAAELSRAIEENKLAQTKLEALQVELTEANKFRAEASIDELVRANADKFPKAKDAEGNPVASDLETTFRKLAAADLDVAKTMLESFSVKRDVEVVSVVNAPRAEQGSREETISPIRAKQVQLLGMTPEDYAKFNPINGTQVPTKRN